MKLNNWSFVLVGDHLYMAPELMQSRLVGIVEGHPRVQDGTVITTSSVVGKYNGCVVTSTGGLYELGEVDPNYEKSYPNAKVRLLSGLVEVAKPDQESHRDRHARHAAEKL